MANVTYEIKQNIAVLSTSAKGWNFELNLISWNGAAPKLDLRDWAPDHSKMSKGVTMTVEQASKLHGALEDFLYHGESPAQVPVPAPQPQPKEEPAPTKVEAEVVLGGKDADPEISPERLAAIAKARELMGEL